MRHARTAGYAVAMALIAGAVVASASAQEFGVAGAWLFDEGAGESAVDAFGGADGELKGAAEWSDDGRFGAAVSLPGEGDAYVNIPHDDVFDADPFTFTAWVRLEPLSWQYIVWRDGEVWPEPRNARHLDIWVHENDNAVAMWHTDDGGEGRIDSVTPIADGEWHHIAKMSDGESMFLYMDGQLEGEAPLGGDLVVNGADNMWIGARPGNVAATGLFDEVGWFTQALTEEELATVMGGGLAPILAVDSAGKLATSWAWMKRQ